MHPTKQHAFTLYRGLSMLLTLVVQLAVLAWAVAVLRERFPLFYLVCMLVSAVLVLLIVREDSNPSYKIPWIITIMLLPIWGGLFYLMCGKPRFSRAEKRRGARLIETAQKALAARPNALEKVPAPYDVQARYLQNHAAAPVYANTAVRFYPLGEDFYADLLADLERAEKSIFFEYFIIGFGEMWDAIHAVLARKAAGGVDVRVIYDDVGCFGFLPADYWRRLEAEGIRCIAFNRFTHIFSSRFNNRDHRKICVIDGNVGYTGGVNIADEYINAKVKYGHWKDTAVRLEGEGVWGLTVLFLSLWDHERRTTEPMERFAPTKTAAAPGFVQPFQDVPVDREYVGQTVYSNMLHRANGYVWIMTPYLIIDSEMIAALTVAAKNGVDVRIITPGVPDKKLVWRLTRSYYAVLLKAGVKIYEYQPGFVHAKQFICDDRCAVVGTINLDYRSLCHHYECGVWMCDVPAIGQMKKDYLNTLEHCRPITLEEYKKKGFGRRLGLSLLRLFAPLF